MASTRKPPESARNSHPSLRLITPSFNQAEFIAESIRSVLEQNYPHLTYFVADGGSTDGTVHLLSELLPRGSWKSERDGGQTACLIEQFSRGDEELLAWVNSDDYLLPGALAAVAERFCRDPELAIVHGDGIFVDAQGRELARIPSVPITRRHLEERNLLHQPSTFFRRSWYERVGGLNPRLSKAFDYDLFLRIVCAGGRCVHVPQVLSAFRLHAGGQTTAMWREFLPEMLAVQWWHGDRRQFARRFAEKLWLLNAHESGGALTHAYEFLAARLDALLGTTAWRRDAPRPAVERFLTAESFLRHFLDQTSWRERGRLGSEALSPAVLRALCGWVSHVTLTGQWGVLLANRRLAARCRHRLRDAA